MHGHLTGFTLSLVPVFTEFSTCFSFILLNLVPVLLNIDLIDLSIDLRIDPESTSLMPHYLAVWDPEYA